MLQPGLVANDPKHHNTDAEGGLGGTGGRGGTEVEVVLGGGVGDGGGRRWWELMVGADGKRPLGK